MYTYMEKSQRNVRRQWTQNSESWWSLETKCGCFCMVSATLGSVESPANGLRRVPWQCTAELWGGQWGGRTSFQQYLQELKDRWSRWRKKWIKNPDLLLVALAWESCMISWRSEKESSEMTVTEVSLAQLIASDSEK